SQGPCVVTQRAGLVARRIVSWLGVDAVADQGQRLGMIKFGSQTGVRVSPAFEPLVSAGNVVRAGLTPIARLPSG
ncbi:MAG: phosphatidylserine decarboxylase, partial [Chloroflexota bacterium]